MEEGRADPQRKASPPSRSLIYVAIILESSKGVLYMVQSQRVSVVSATWEAEAGGSLEPKSLKPAWATEQDEIFTKIKLVFN